MTDLGHSLVSKGHQAIALLLCFFPRLRKPEEESPHPPVPRPGLRRAMARDGPEKLLCGISVPGLLAEVKATKSKGTG